MLRINIKELQDTMNGRIDTIMEILDSYVDGLNILKDRVDAIENQLLNMTNAS